MEGDAMKNVDGKCGRCGCKTTFIHVEKDELPSDALANATAPNSALKDAYWCPSCLRFLEVAVL
jgi:hypothetical protein